MYVCMYAARVCMQGDPPLGPEPTGADDNDDKWFTNPPEGHCLTHVSALMLAWIPTLCMASATVYACSDSDLSQEAKATVRCIVFRRRLLA